MSMNDRRLGAGRSFKYIVGIFKWDSGSTCWYEKLKMSRNKSKCPYKKVVILRILSKFWCEKNTKGLKIKNVDIFYTNLSIARNKRNSGWIVQICLYKGTNLDQLFISKKNIKGKSKEGRKLKFRRKKEKLFRYNSLNFEKKNLTD